MERMYVEISVYLAGPGTEFRISEKERCDLHPTSGPGTIAVQVDSLTTLVAGRVQAQVEQRFPEDPA